MIALDLNGSEELAQAIYVAEAEAGKNFGAVNNGGWLDLPLFIREIKIAAARALLIAFGMAGVTTGCAE